MFDVPTNFIIIIGVQLLVDFKKKKNVLRLALDYVV